jgi:hypothetical protein
MELLCAVRAVRLCRWIALTGCLAAHNSELAQIAQMCCSTYCVFRGDPADERPAGSPVQPTNRSEAG